MKTTERNTIQSVRLALERIEVRGSGNLDLLLGCIQALDRLLAEAEAEEVSDG